MSELSKLTEVIGLNQDPKVGNVTITLQEYQDGPWAFLEGTEDQFRELYESLKKMFDFGEDAE